MRGSTGALLLGAACLIALWGVISSAQVIDSNACQRACYEQKGRCVTACGMHDDPVECDADCHDQLTDCVRECR
jgi:hypothetical protein